MTSQSASALTSRTSFADADPEPERRDEMYDSLNCKIVLKKLVCMWLTEMRSTLEMLHLHCRLMTAFL